MGLFQQRVPLLFKEEEDSQSPAFPPNGPSTLETNKLPLTFSDTNKLKAWLTSGWVRLPQQEPGVGDANNADFHHVKSKTREQW